MRHADLVHIAIINRHPKLAVRIRLKIDGAADTRLSIRELGSEQYFRAPVAWRAHNADYRSGNAEFSVSRHAFAVVTVNPA